MAQAKHQIPQPRNGHEIHSIEFPARETTDHKQFGSVDPTIFLSSIGGNVARGETVTGPQLLIRLLEETDSVPTEQHIFGMNQYVSALAELRNNPKVMATARFKSQYGELGLIPKNITDEMIVDAKNAAESALFERTTIIRDLKETWDAYESEYVIVGANKQARVDIIKNAELCRETEGFVQTDPLLYFTSQLLRSAKSEQEKTYALTLDRFARYMAKKAHTNDNELANQ